MRSPSILGRIVRRLSGQEGFSVAELTVAAALMAIVIAVTGTALTNDLLRVNDLDHESRNVDVLRLAMARIERDIRSAECIGTPDASSVPTAQGTTLAMMTSAGGGPSVDVIWSMPVGGGNLTRTEAGNSVVIASAMDAGTLFTHLAPNELVANEPNRSRIRVKLVRSAEGGQRNDRTVETIVTARNANVAVPAAACP